MEAILEKPRNSQLITWFCGFVVIIMSRIYRDSNNLQRQCQILDDYLNNSLKKRILIKPDGHCLLHAVFNGIKPANTVLEL